MYLKRETTLCLRILDDYLVSKSWPWFRILALAASKTCARFYSYSWRCLLYYKMADIVRMMSSTVWYGALSDHDRSMTRIPCRSKTSSGSRRPFRNLSASGLEGNGIATWKERRWGKEREEMRRDDCLAFLWIHKNTQMYFFIVIVSWILTKLWLCFASIKQELVSFLNEFKAFA